MVEQSGEIGEQVEALFDGAKAKEREALYACLVRRMGGWDWLLNDTYGPWDKHWHLPVRLGGPENFRNAEDRYEPMTPAEVEVLRAARAMERLEHFGSIETSDS